MRRCSSSSTSWWRRLWGADRRAIGAITIALGPALLEEARSELGEGREDEAGEVLQRFFLAMSEGMMTFTGAKGGGLDWMKRAVRREGRRGAPHSKCRLH